MPLRALREFHVSTVAGSREETKGRFCKRAALATVRSLVPVFGVRDRRSVFFAPSLRVLGVHRSVFCTLIPVFRDSVQGTSAKTTLLETTLLRTSEEV